MFQAESLFHKKITDDPYLFTNLVFGFFPISFILGSLIVNLNLSLICILGIYHLKSKILTTKINFALKIIFLFFLIIFISTLISFIKTTYLYGYDNSVLERLFKSILFFRFFLFLLIIYFLCKFNVLNLRYFFFVAAFSSILVSLDLILQYLLGFNTIGLKSFGFSNTGFFGQEKIAGGYILRFSFFSIFLLVFLFQSKKYIKNFSSVAIICILASGMLFSGNRMPIVLFLFGLCLLFVFKPGFKKIVSVSFVALFLLFQLIINTNDSYKKYIYNAYKSYYQSVNSIIPLFSKTYVTHAKVENIEKDVSVKSKKIFYEVKFDSMQKRVLLASIETWKQNKIFGNGIKSFRGDCWELEKRPDTYMGEDLHPDKKNLLCSTHPHNYYFEILTETGIVGLVIIIIIALMFLIYIYKNLKFLNDVSYEKAILLASIISLILETIPLRSTGSIFTSNNATYLVLISAIVLCHKMLIKINNQDE